ncbi:SNF2-related protein, partial [Streptomyces alkaliphilus]|uniref:SNF2-related protein n=1 Tax=Streptomyces alkaliphilus TaxID=1472722 RepID=UPI00117EDF71|nr:helicase [Streptomyces alkaliphilus]
MAAQGEIRFPPGARVLVRDEEWLVRTSRRAGHPGDGDMLDVIGVSEFVRDEEAVFFTGIDRVELLRPEDTTLVPDTSSYFRRARLFLEAVLRKTPLPQTERGLALADRFLLDALPYQQRPAELALSMRNLRPRLLIADVVGLGKTLEIGLLLAELIRRGRGERLLVVTPQSILEQFQHELWTRFSIPLVRLDSLGIQRIQREIPAGRNPFTHYKRVIISVDTLKDIGRYRHHLERIEWDAVVIDESHNLINHGSQRRALAETLAPRTDALILASATPHNGDRRSFADLVSLLDPVAIRDPEHYDPVRDLSHLYIRRTKNSPEVRQALGSTVWAERADTRSVRCAATPAEEEIFAELTEHWLPPLPADPTVPPALDAPEGNRRERVGADPLFAFNLLKSLLSSHRALRLTVTRRIATLERRLREAEEEGATPDPAIRGELPALERLRKIAEGMGDGTAEGDSAKLDALVAELRALGVGPGGDTRVVVFSERVETLEWLAEVVPARLGFPAGPAGDAPRRGDGPADSGVRAQGAARLMHGGLSEEEQRRCREEFGLAGTPLRMLFTGDISSEGVNLHRQCHHLVHYDIPWSLIRIEQRNGRIDRYGQTREPRFLALILTSAHPGARDDRTVAEKLLAREREAYALNGTAEAVTGCYRAEEEERRLVRELVRGGTVEGFLADAAPGGGDDAPGGDGMDLAALFGQVDALVEEEPPTRAEVPSLFDGDTAAFVDAALAELYDDRPEDAIGLARDVDGRGRPYLSLAPDRAPDLRRRLKSLPPSYLRKVGERMVLSPDRSLAGEKLEEARRSGATMWPEVSFLSDLHPVVEWLTDRLLVRFGRREAPIITSPRLDGPVYLVQGIGSNALGRPTVVRWMAVSPDPAVPVRPMTEVLAEAGVGPGLARTTGPADPGRLRAALPGVLDRAREHLREAGREWEESVAGPLAAYRERVARWRQDTLPGADPRGERVIEEIAEEQTRLTERLGTSGPPLLRVLAVLDRPAPEAAPGTGPGTDPDTGPDAPHPIDT